MKDKIILGVHAGHDSSACLIIGNKLISAIEKERITRKKHDNGEPIECIEYILINNNLSKDDIDLVVRANWWNANDLNEVYYEQFKNVISTNEHHLLHALSSYATSPFNEEFCLVIDGHGARQIDINPNSIFYSKTFNYETESVYIFNNGNIIEYDKRFAINYKNKYIWGSFLNSLGYMYGIASSLIFDHANHAGKTMGLAPLGKNNHLIPKALIYNENSFEVSDQWLDFINKNWKLKWNTNLAKDISFAAQKELEEYYHFRVKQIFNETGIKNVSLSGGVALNCKNNGLVANYNFLDNAFVYNACGDSGISLGAAVYGIYRTLGYVPKLEWSAGLGAKYKNSNKITVDIDKVVKLLIDDEIISVFQGGSEFGPRALGNRSILASPINSFMKDKINYKIKHRESFRPFGGSILRKHLHIISDDKYCSDYMLSALKVKKEVYRNIESVIHIDGTSRLHIIDDENSLIGMILTKFYRLTGIPVLINTSFNDNNEPIVETFENALDTCKKNNIKYLLLPNKLIDVIEP